MYFACERHVWKAEFSKQSIETEVREIDMNRIMGMLAFMLVRKASQAAVTKLNRARARVELGNRPGYEVQGRLMVRKKMAGRFLPLEQIAELAGQLQGQDEDLYFYSPDNTEGDKHYVHAIRITRLDPSEKKVGDPDASLELEVLPSWSHRGVYVKNVSDQGLAAELEDLMRRLANFQTANDDFTFRSW